MLRSATEHYRRQQRIAVAGLLEAKRARRRGAREAAKVVTAYQILAAKDAADSVPLMLAEQGIEDAPEGAVKVSGLAGVASDGRPLDTLFEQADSDYKFALMVATQLQDVARLAAGIGIAARPAVTGYARMLNPPSCSRCAILAGKFFKWNKGFERHPQCDCRHVPSVEAKAGDLTTDPRAYFDSLPPGDQNRTFGKRGAQAIRDGADMGQVVNISRNGLSTTATHIPRRGAGSMSTDPNFVPTVRPGMPDLLAGFSPASRYPTQALRMTPEGIYTTATSRAQAISLLRTHGYLL